MITLLLALFITASLTLAVAGCEQLWDVLMAVPAVAQVDIIESTLMTNRRRNNPNIKPEPVAIIGAPAPVVKRRRGRSRKTEQLSVFALQPARI